MRGPPLEPLSAEPKPDPLRNYLKQLETDPEARGRWIDQVELLLPDHTHRGNGIHYVWTNPLGVWHLEINISDVFYGRGVTIKGPRGEWRPRDIRPESLKMLLIVLEAIE